MKSKEKGKTCNYKFISRIRAFLFNVVYMTSYHHNTCKLLYRAVILKCYLEHTIAKQNTILYKAVMTSLYNPNGYVFS